MQLKPAMNTIHSNLINGLWLGLTVLLSAYTPQVSLSVLESACGKNEPFLFFVEQPINQLFSPKFVAGN